MVLRFRVTRRVHHTQLGIPFWNSVLFRVRRHNTDNVHWSVLYPSLLARSDGARPSYGWQDPSWSDARGGWEGQARSIVVPCRRVDIWQWQGADDGYGSRTPRKLNLYLPFPVPRSTCRCIVRVY